MKYLDFSSHLKNYILNKLQKNII